MKKTLLFAALILFAVTARCELQNPAKWRFAYNNESLTFAADIDEGWHLYGLDIPEGGPRPVSFTVEHIEGAELIGGVAPESNAIEKYDELFKMTLQWYEKTALFKQRIKVTDPALFSISGEVEYMLCNDEVCLSPTRVPFVFGKEPAASSNPSPRGLLGSFDDIDTPQDKSESGWWTPVIDELKEMGDQTLTAADRSLWIIFLTGFVGGLIALVTPCVWPMIPMTVSFFLKQKQNKRKSRSQVAIYSISIVAIYLGLGLLITLIFGASALNSLATSAFFNLLFFFMLIFFAVSFFGTFDITLPVSWSNKMDKKADSASGLVSIFFMAFTLALVSFSCTGPIIGTLLVQAATSGSLLAPAVGMLGFALALAFPFTFFAAFPAWLQSLPKSGGWLNSVKVVLGFLELALAFKFLSVADLAYDWGILNRDVFLAIWIVIFAMLGLYLLGKLRLPHDGETTNISPTRLMLAMASIAFAIYMIPGLWGAPLKSISAFAPPLYTQDFNLYKDEVHAHFTDYDEAMEYAKKAKKPLLVDFTGYGCVNCRKMEASVWTKPEVKAAIERDFVLVSLYVDDRKPLAVPEEIIENDKTLKLRNYGDKWSYLQRMKFGANAQPFYVILDNSGAPLAPSFPFSEDAAAFLRFMEQGKANYAD